MHDTDDGRVVQAAGSLRDDGVTGHGTGRRGRGPDRRPEPTRMDTDTWTHRASTHTYRLDEMHDMK